MSAVAAHRLDRAIENAVRFLLAGQSPAGFWSDWDLPPGPSRVWTTAYVGFRLAGSGVDTGTPLAPALARAVEWLSGQQYPAGGWGYDQEVGPDADSTALAILFLHSQGVEVRSPAYDLLLSLQQPDGGFATYAAGRSFGAWTMPHADVTAAALLALLTRWDRIDPPLARGLRRCLADATPCGLWNSYWWASCLYATEINLALLRASGTAWDAAVTRATLKRIRPRNPFEAALLLSCLLLAGPPCDPAELADTSDYLLRCQCRDGGWPTARVLRLTSRHIRDPWRHRASGPLFADPQRLFTTATVVAALQALRAVPPDQPAV